MKKNLSSLRVVDCSDISLVMFIQNNVHNSQSNSHTHIQTQTHISGVKYALIKIQVMLIF
jgi:hypothetical protein